MELEAVKTEKSTHEEIQSLTVGDIAKAIAGGSIGMFCFVFSIISAVAFATWIYGPLK